MLTEYITLAMRQATYNQIDDGTYFGEIPGFPGVWANAETIAACTEELQEVFEDWIVLSLRQGHPLPIVDSIDLNISTEPIPA